MGAQPGPQTGNIYRSPINAIGTKFADIDIPSLGVRISNHAIKERGGETWPVLSVKASVKETSWELLYAKMEMLVTSLAIGTITQAWLSDYIYDEKGKEVWKKPGTLRMIVEKEGDPLEADNTSPNLMTLMVDLVYHTARNYPRVFMYHYIGLLLLRTPLVGYNLNSEILLNFFKMGELVTATRTGEKPNLRSILDVCKKLKSSYEPSEVKEFWKVRSRDAAHDHMQAQNVERKLAVDCKLWAEELVISDWRDRGQPIVKRRRD